MWFGERIKSLREERGWSQKDLADNLNLHRVTINKYEMQDEHEMIKTLIAMSDLFNTSVDFILGLTDCREKYPRIASVNKSDIVNLLDGLDKDQLKVIYEKATVLKRKHGE